MILDDYTYLLPGDSLPEMRIADVDGNSIFPDNEGRISLISFFITGCPHCKEVFDILDREVWPIIRDTKQIILAIGRNHDTEEVSNYRKSRKLNFPFAADPAGEIYRLFAEKKVPRNYLFDRRGKLVFQTRGYDTEQMHHLIITLNDLLLI